MTILSLVWEGNPIQIHFYTPKRMIYIYIFPTQGKKANDNLLQKNISQLFYLGKYTVANAITARYIT